MANEKHEHELIIVINGIHFYKGNLLLDGKQLVYTNNENYHVDADEDLEKACWRIYNLWCIEKDK